MSIHSAEGFFTIAFEPGVEELRSVAFEAMKMFAFKNMLDFTEFPSMIKMEKTSLTSQFPSCTMRRSREPSHSEVLKAFS